MSTPILEAFFHAAAAAYRKTGVPEATVVAERLEGHAGRPFVAEPTDRPPAIAHLSAACAAADAHPVLAALGPAIHRLPWTEGELPVPASFKGRYAYAALIGPGLPIADKSMYFGLYLQSPDSYYPNHWHLAEELYYVLSGTAEWRQGASPLAAKPSGTLVQHKSNVPHAMQTRTPPLLAMWAWIGDLREGTYRIEPAASD